MKNQKRRQETRNKILNTASFFFAQKGYDGTGVAEICQEANISKGAFYYHFRSKEEVFLELINSWLEQLEENLKEIDSKSSDVPETLVQMSFALKEIFQFPDRQAPLFLELWVKASREETIREITLAPYRKYQQIFARLMEEGIKEGSIKNFDPHEGAQAILSLASGMFLQGLLDPEMEWEKTAPRVLNIILEGIRKE